MYVLKLSMFGYLFVDVRCGVTIVIELYDEASFPCRGRGIFHANIFLNRLDLPFETFVDLGGRNIFFSAKQTANS